MTVAPESRDERIPKVSVKVVTYNHEDYIRAALDSVFGQRVDFPIEVVIGDDGSTDRTPQILEEYRDRHPGEVRLLLSDRNRGWRDNTRRTLRACRGEYIAVLDGDDYWTDDEKLRKQVEYLEGRRDCTICFHNTEWVFEDGSAPKRYHDEPLPEIMTLKDLLQSNLMHSGAIVFRNGLFDAFPAAFDAVPFNDWPLQVLCAEKGRIGYIHAVMSAHRVHGGGAWSAGGDSSLHVRARHCRWRIVFYEAASEYLGAPYRELMRGRIRDLKLDVLKIGLTLAIRRLYRGFRPGS